MSNVIKYRSVKTEAAVMKQIDEVASKANGLKEAIQQACISVIQHAERTGDVRIGNKLIQALGEAGRGDAAVKFLVTFGHFEVGKDEETKKRCFTGFKGGMSHDQAKARIRETFSEAKATWWSSTIKTDSFKEENWSQKIMDTANNYAKAIQRKNKLIAEGDTEKAAKIVTDISDTAKQHFLQVVGITFPEIESENDDQPEAGVKSA